MPRPKNKPELLDAIEKERGELETLLDNIPPDDKIEPGVVGEWSVKDVLAHLVEWEQMALGWYRAGLKDEVPEMPAPGYKWNQTPELNQMIYEKHCERHLDDVMEEFHASHKEILGLIESLSNEELFTPQRYAWTRKNAMGTYFVSATSSHYFWARKEIRKGLKAKAG